MGSWRLLEIPIKLNSAQATTLRSSFDWCMVVLELTNEAQLLLLFFSSSEFLDALNRGDWLEMLYMISEDWEALLRISVFDPLLALFLLNFAGFTFSKSVLHRSLVLELSQHDPLRGQGQNRYDELWVSLILNLLRAHWRHV